MNKDTKIIKTICTIASVISIILVVGTVGGLEGTTLTFLKSVIWQIGSWVMFTLSLIIGNKMQAIEDGRGRHGTRKAIRNQN